MDSRSTRGNPYIIDIFQKVPYNMPIIRRSTKFQTGAGRKEEGAQTQCRKPLDFKLKANVLIHQVGIEGMVEKKE